MAFLDLKKKFGAETERARDLFLAVWLSDLFMNRVDENGDWYLMCPDECPGLTEKWGEEFEQLYEKYVSEGKFRQKMEARKIMKAILDSQLETGTPYVLFKDTANRKSNQQNIGTIKSSNLCVHEDTMILTNKGYKNIKSLEDTEVEVWNGEQWSKTTVRKTGTNKDLIRVNLSNGSYLDCTPEHKFYIQENYSSTKPIETQAKDLKINDNLIKFELPKPIILENPEEFKYAYTHGFFCGDGTYVGKNKTRPRISLYGIKKNLLTNINHTSYSINEDNDRYDLVLPKDINKKFTVPFNASINDKLRWFEGYCDADGTISRNGTNEALQISSIEYNFLLDVRLMLHTLSVESKITLNKEERQSLLPDGNGGKKYYDCKSIYRLLISSSELYKLSKLGFKPKRLTFVEREPQRDASHFVKVTSIEESYINVDTYCFTEPLKNMGVFNGILTGQCAEILLYSDDKEYAVCNLASIAVNNFIKPFEQKETFMFHLKTNDKNSKLIQKLLTNKKFKFEEIKETNEKESVVYYGEKKVGGLIELYDFIKSSYDFDKLEEVAYTATINLDRVIDVNYYPTIETKLSNMKHRPIGIGIQGLADAIVMLKIPFDSDESVNFNSKMMESIYLGCVRASKDIAKNRHDKMKFLIDAKVIVPEFYDFNFILQDKELNKLYHELTPCKYEIERNTNFYGTYSSFDGSPFSKGILQFDMWNVIPSQKEKWDELKKEIAIYGLRNSQLTALMPTATTSQILGNNECFEPITSNIYMRRTLAGEFIMVNKYLMKEFMDLGIWNERVKNNIIANRGSIQQFFVKNTTNDGNGAYTATLPGLTEHTKDKYKTVWEIPMKHLIDMAADRGAFICQSQSLNLWLEEPNYNTLTSMHFYSWTRGLKTGIYYLRRKPKHQAQQFTIEPEKKEVEEKDEICEMCSA
jgi:ribonucleoside-diphosphate reductase alpha chain